MNKKKNKLDIIIPIFNEEDNISIIYNKIKGLKIHENYSIIFIDDGSKDKSWNEIKKLIKKDKKVKGISFSRNFGHQISLSAGIDYSNSDILIMMDGDLQHPPELIPQMLNKFYENYDVVQMVKKDQVLLQIKGYPKKN